MAHCSAHFISSHQREFIVITCTPYIFKYDYIIVLCLPGKIVCLQCIMLHVLCAYLNERGLFTTHPEGGIVGDSNGQLSLGMAIGDSRVWWVRLHAFM